MTAPRRAHRRLRRLAVGAIGLAIIGGTLTSVAIATDTLGAGQRWESLVARVDRFLAGPVPDRPTVGTVRVTPPPSATPTPSATAAAGASGGVATPPPTPTPEPARTPVDVDIAS